MVIMSSKVFIDTIDEVWASFNGPQDAYNALSDHFTFKVENAHFKKGNRRWDGSIKLFNKKTRKLYKGLVPEAVKLLSEQSFDIQLSPLFKKHTSFVKRNDIIEVCDEINSYTPHNYQVDAVYEALKFGRRTLLSPTASGKSFIIYILLRLFQEIGHSVPDKALIIVPTVSLVSQLESDFQDYSKNDPGFDRSRVEISTWQSIYKNEKSYFQQYGCVIGDEVHHFKAKSLKTIMEACTEAAYRYGLTGTLDDVEVNKLVIEGLFGPVYQVTKTKDLINKNVLSQLEPIDLVHFSYSKKDRSEWSKGFSEYNDEVSYLCKHDKRTSTILDLIEPLEGNTLVLFNRIDEQGKPLFELIKNDPRFIQHEKYFISGAVDKSDREEIRINTNNSERAIILGSAGTMSTGVNIPNLHNLVLIMPGKAKIRLLQSLGRILRKSDNNQKATVIDIIDDLSHGAKKNHSLRHAQKRVEIYQAEGFPIKTRKINL